MTYCTNCSTSVCSNNIRTRSHTTIFPLFKFNNNNIVIVKFIYPTD